MLTIPSEYTTACSNPGTVTTLPYGEKYALLYTPAKPAQHILYLIHGGGGDQHSFFCPAFLNIVDHMMEDGTLAPLYIVSPCFYDPKETDKTPASSGIAVRRFITELREQVIPMVADDRTSFCTGKVRHQRLFHGRCDHMVCLPSCP